MKDKVEQKVFKPMDEESAENLKQDIKYTCYESLKEGRDIRIDEFVQRCIGEYIDVNRNTTPNDAVWVEQAMECAMEELLQEGIYVITTFRVLENKPVFMFDICFKAVDSEEIINASPMYMANSVKALPLSIQNIINNRKQYIEGMQDVGKADDFKEAIKSNKELQKEMAAWAKGECKKEKEDDQ